MHATLRDFLDALDQAGELHRIATPVSPILEISEIAGRVSKSPCARESRYAAEFDPDHADLGGSALLFENVEGCDFPLAINTFGSYRRMEMALGVEESGGFEAIAQKIASLAKPQPPSSLRDLLSKAREFAPLLRIPPRRARRGACQEVVKLTERGEVDLTRLPLIKCWPFDGDPRTVGYEVSPEQAGTAKGEGRYITFAGMHTIHADDEGAAKPASHNIGMYRAQLIDETRLAMHWHVHHDGAAHWRSWKRQGKPMPIAICLGGESVLPYAATAPLPPGISELLMAGFLNRRGIPLVPCRTVPLRVPANCEIVIEGWVSTECGEIGWAPGGPSPPTPLPGGEGSDAPSPPAPLPGGEGDGLGPGAVFEGPFGDHTGFYSMPDRYPIVDVTAVTHRRDAVFPATIVGYPPQEDYYLGKATERIFLPLLQTLIHDIDDYHLPMFGAFHNAAFVRIRKAYPLQARRVMHAIWGAGQMAWTKFIVVVDEHVDVHDEVAVLRAVFQNCHFGRDFEIVNGPLDILDHAGPRLGAGHKMGIDATRKMPGEEVNGVAVDPPTPAHATGAGTQRSSSVHLPEFGDERCAFLAVRKQSAGEGLRNIEAFVRGLPDDSPVDFIIAVDDSIDLNDHEAVLFHWCANCDPGRDLIVFGLDGSESRFGRVAFDATSKYPGDARLGQPVRKWPPFMLMDDATRRKVDERWAAYGVEVGRLSEPSRRGTAL